ncbi:hypothetical protein [Gordonia hydrophobica]|uniref:Uncharacterized protein n=1 Tax=Gordonia hydrophobica TaxID=40516 RepID=A0ABZ2U5M2_9ACTN|nr:hypothetical protein [Gordonia hydrophobica]MBM7367462.1 hypothetical protein [Gordonia hydrophobica]
MTDASPTGTLPPARQRAIDIYHDLGWHDLPLERLAAADIGTPEQRREARAGLGKGEWGSFGEHARGSWSWQWNLGDTDPGRLALFAIAIGVDARRALAVLSWEVDPVIAARLIADRGPAFTAQFVTAACVSSRRGSTHGPTAYGSIAIRAADLADIPVPDSVEYLKDWAVFSDAVLCDSHSEIWTHIRVPDADALTRRFSAHAIAAAHAGVALTGPFRAVLAAGVARGLLDRDDAIDLAFDGLDTAQRPGDKSGWLEFLTVDLQVDDSEFVGRTEQLVPVLAAGVSPVTATIAPMLIATCDDDILPDIVTTALSATPTKTRKAIITALTARPRPSDAVTDEVLAAVETVADVRGLATALTKLTQAWAVSVASPVSARVELIDWIPTPAVWEVPRFDAGPVTLDALVDTARELYARRDDATVDVTVERFLALTAALSHTDLDGVRSVLSGVDDSVGAGLRHVAAPCDCGDPSCRDDAATSLGSARERSLFARLGEIPVLLSTPSWVDLRIHPADLLAGLRAYEAAGRAVAESDLLLALTRTDTALLDAITLAAIDAVDVTVDRYRRGPTHAGKLAAAALREPLREPAPDPENRRGLTTPGSLTKTRWLTTFDVEIARTWYGDQNLTTFPTWIDHHDGYVSSTVDVAQRVRRSVPLSPTSIRELLTVDESSIRDSPGYLTGLAAAFERGLLRPGPIGLFGGAYAPSRPMIARLLDHLAQAGALAFVWPIVDEILADAAHAPRIPAGTADIVALASRLLPSVERAVAAGAAPKDSLAVPGLRAVAARSGSSIAVTDARSLVVGLGGTISAAPTRQPAIKTVAALTDRPFREIWNERIGGAPTIDDGATITARWRDPAAKTRAMVVTLTYPELPGRAFDLAGTWIYALEHEGQDQGVEYSAAFDSASDDPEPMPAWLHWDATNKRIAVERRRDGVGDVDAPPRSRHSSRLPTSLLAKPIAALCDENDAGRYELPRLIDRGVASADTVALVTRQLIRCDAVSPARLVRILELEPTTMPALWPLLTESIAYAATLDAVPRWLNRVLDVALQCRPYLAEAVDRRLAPESAATWPGIADIAARPGTSAALTKARQLAELSRTAR